MRLQFETSQCPNTVKLYATILMEEDRGRVGYESSYFSTDVVEGLPLAIPHHISRLFHEFDTL